MDLEIKYRGRQATNELEFINTLIAQNPDISRCALSYKLCETWNWRQLNGHLRDMVCRGFLLCLDRAGYIRLPDKKCTPHNPFLERKKPAEVRIDQTPVYTFAMSLIAGCPGIIKTPSTLDDSIEIPCLPAKPNFFWLVQTCRKHHTVFQQNHKQKTRHGGFLSLD